MSVQGPDLQWSAKGQVYNTQPQKLKMKSNVRGGTPLKKIKNSTNARDSSRGRGGSLLTTKIFLHCLRHRANSVIGRTQ